MKMKRTKILATYGPSIASESAIKALIEAGVNAFRINCSHGDTDDFLTASAIIRRVSEATEYRIGLLFDISGPKLRLTRFDGELAIKTGDHLTLTYDTTDLKRRMIAVNHPGIIDSIRPGERFFIDDGNIGFVTMTVATGTVEAEALNDGTLFPGKGVNLPQTDLQIPTISERDARDIATAVEAGADYIALSFVRSGDDVIRAKRLIEAAGGYCRVIAKLEKAEAMDNLEEILLVSDGAMVARGDLGVELPFEQLPHFQRRIIHEANRHRKPVIVATQMLESMRFSPRATRAEVSDVATAVYDHVDAVMLSAETASGGFPIEAVRTMTRVIDATEAVASRPTVAVDSLLIESGPALAIAEAVAALDTAVPASLIFAFTASGMTAEIMANLFPAQPVIALTPSETVLRRLSLYRSVYAVHAEHADSFLEMLQIVERTNARMGLAEPGEMVIVTGGAPFGGEVPTNFMMFHELGKG